MKFTERGVAAAEKVCYAVDMTKTKKFLKIARVGLLVATTAVAVVEAVKERRES